MRRRYSVTVTTMRAVSLIATIVRIFISPFQLSLFNLQRHGRHASSRRKAIKGSPLQTVVSGKTVLSFLGAGGPRIALATFFAILLMQGHVAAQSNALTDATKSLESLATLDNWIRNWSVPSDPQQIDPAGATGASVTLRMSGKILGRAAVMSTDGDAIWRAAQSALLHADRNLPFENDALREANTLDMAKRLGIELEIAGQLTPLLGDSFEAAAAISPGRAGLAASIGNRMVAVFPSAMLSSNAPPADGLRAAAGKLELPPLELGELREAHHLNVYRFGVRHIFQGSASEAPIFLYRGGRIIPLSNVTTPYLIALSAAIATNLQGRAWPGDEPHGILGDYLPHADRYDPMIASPFSQSLAAFALARYVETPGLPASLTAEALAFASMLVQQATIVTPAESDPLERATDASMWLLARSAVERAQDGRLLVVQEAFAKTALERAVSAIDDDGIWDRTLRPGERALVAYALVIESKRDDAPPELTQRAARAAGRLMLDIDASQLVSLMPWIGWAHLELAPEPGPLPAEVALRELRDVVWRHQVRESDLGEDSQDFVGGVVFTRGRAALPSWQTMRPMAFLATALGDDRLTTRNERSSELSSLRLSLRFLLQLTVDPPAAQLLPDAQRAMGGVKAAPWDATMSVEASALGLLVVTETLKAIKVP